jgi:hypothetical protein
MTVSQVSREEAERHGWIGQENPDHTLNVDMCLECQMIHSKSRGVHSGT